jgi:hypothetical protein
MVEVGEGGGGSNRRLIGNDDDGRGGLGSRTAGSVTGFNRYRAILRVQVQLHAGRLLIPDVTILGIGARSGRRTRAAGSTMIAASEAGAQGRRQM